MSHPDHDPEDGEEIPLPHEPSHFQPKPRNDRRPMSNENKKPDEKKKPGLGLKETVTIVGVIAAAHLGYDVYDREFRTPPPTLVQQYENLVRTNQATWDALVKIKGMTPPAVKNAR